MIINMALFILTSDTLICTRFNMKQLNSNNLKYWLDIRMQTTYQKSNNNYDNEYDIVHSYFRHIDMHTV